MSSRKRIRRFVELPPEVRERLDAVAEARGATKGSILAAAFTAYLENRGTGELERGFAIRLNRISAQLERIERNGHVGLESLALFVRYMLTVNAPVAEYDEVARAVGRDRFAAFVARVGQQLASGRRTLDPEEEP
jgi:predicted transcriptional regulator